MLPYTTIIVLMCLSIVSAKIMRNKALMTKMVSNFRNDITEETLEPKDKAQTNTVLTRMQNVLCKNFPSIPCDLITSDNTLKKLIEKSIQEINYKKVIAEKTTAHPRYLTLFPIINSEDLSNFLQVRDDGVAKNSRRKKAQRKKKEFKIKQKTGREKRIQKNKSKRTTLHNRKKIRKFYPHKVKYKDKVAGSVREEFGDRSEDRLSMSVEVPDMTLAKKHQHFAYKVEPAEPPVWRIDYMKHDEPNMNMFAFNGIKTNLKTGPNVILDNNAEHAVRKDVLHPDVYIKNNYIRKNSNMNSEPVD